MSLNNPQLCHKTAYNERAARLEVTKRTRSNRRRKKLQNVHADYCAVCDQWHISVDKSR